MVKLKISINKKVLLKVSLSPLFNKETVSNHIDLKSMTSNDRQIDLNSSNKLSKFWLMMSLLFIISSHQKKILTKWNNFSSYFQISQIIF